MLRGHPSWAMTPPRKRTRLSSLIPSTTHIQPHIRPISRLGLSSMPINIILSQLLNYVFQALGNLKGKKNRMLSQCVQSQSLHVSHWALVSLDTHNTCPHNKGRYPFSTIYSLGHPLPFQCFSVCT
jgi:hypothetical protein